MLETIIYLIAFVFIGIPILAVILYIMLVIIGAITAILFDWIF